MTEKKPGFFKKIFNGLSATETDMFTKDFLMFKEAIADMIENAKNKDDFDKILEHLNVYKNHHGNSSELRELFDTVLFRITFLEEGKGE